jgi:heme/copper-type cytochrome/quinol oxidase subunit 2
MEPIILTLIYFIVLIATFVCIWRYEGEATTPEGVTAVFMCLFPMFIVALLLYCISALGWYGVKSNWKELHTL